MVWQTASFSPQEVVNFAMNSYLTMVVSLGNWFSFITVCMPLVVSCSWSPRSPLLFFQAAVLLSPKLSLTLLAQLSFVEEPNTTTETPTSTKAQCLLIPDSCKKEQEHKGQQKREQRKTADARIEARYERGTAMKRVSVWREALSLGSQWDPSSSNPRKCLYIAVIMGCNGFVNEGNKETNSSLVPRCHLPFSLVSL